MIVNNIQRQPIRAIRSVLGNIVSKSIEEYNTVIFRPDIHNNYKVLYLNEKPNPTQPFKVEGYNTTTSSYDVFVPTSGNIAGITQYILDSNNGLIFFHINVDSVYSHFKINYYGDGTLIDWNQLVNVLIENNTWFLPIIEFRDFTLNEPDISDLQNGPYKFADCFINTLDGISSINHDNVKANHIYMVEDNNVWREFAPNIGQVLYNKSDDKYYKFNGTSWEEWDAGGGTPGDSLWTLNNVEHKLYDTNNITTDIYIIGAENINNNIFRFYLNKNNKQFIISDYDFSGATINNNVIIYSIDTNFYNNIHNLLALVKNTNIDNVYESILLTKYSNIKNTNNITALGNNIDINNTLTDHSSNNLTIYGNNAYNFNSFANIESYNYGSGIFETVKFLLHSNQSASIENRKLYIRGTSNYLFKLGQLNSGDYIKGILYIELNLDFKDNVDINSANTGWYKIFIKCKVNEITDPSTETHIEVIAKNFITVYEDIHFSFGETNLLYDNSTDSFYFEIENVQPEYIIEGDLIVRLNLS